MSHPILSTLPFSRPEKLPRTGVFICGCGGKISDQIDCTALQDAVAPLPGVAYCAYEAYPCSIDGRERIQKIISEHDLERVLIAGCSPRLVEKLFKETAQSAGLDPGFVHVANIREQAAYLYPGDQDQAENTAFSLIEMGLARVSNTTPPQPQTGRVVRAVLVIGSGLSALTVALSLAQTGTRVILVEASDWLQPTPPDLQERTRQLAEEKGRDVLSNDLIEVLLNARILEVTGHPGDYEARVLVGESEQTYAIGAIVVANGARPKELSASRWFDRTRVKTQAEYETELEGIKNQRTPLTLENVVMILCAEPTQLERCSRVCCQIGIRQAMQTRQLIPDANVTVLFRDLYLGGQSGAYEHSFVDARQQGVTFFRYRREQPPVIGNQTVDVLDTLTGDPVRIPFDRVVLSMPLAPEDNSASLASLLSLPQDEAGFLAEPRVRLRPGRYADPGIYVLGSAHQPADTTEALFQAYLTGSRVARFLSQDSITVQTGVSTIDPSLCTGCGTCVQVCPVSAIHLEKRDGILSRSEVDKLRCRGCGNCAVVCPAKAITLPGWDNIEIPAQISAGLNGANGQGEIVVLACEWSAYAAADVAGVRNRGRGSPEAQIPPNVRIIRMNCSARFDPYHILWAFLNGASGVYLGACPPGECHYGSGNLYAMERVQVLKQKLAQHGIDPRRLRLEFMSVDEGEKFADTIRDFVQEIQTEIADPVSRNNGG